MMYYIALDVREIEKIEEIDNSYGIASIKTQRIYVVIAGDRKSRDRVRFEFYDGYSEKVLNKTRYYGYKGDFSTLIKGDYFEVEEPTEDEPYEYVRRVRL